MILIGDINSIQLKSTPNHLLEGKTMLQVRVYWTECFANTVNAERLVIFLS